MARRDLSGAVDFTVLEAMTGGMDEVTEEVLGLFAEQARIDDVVAKVLAAAEPAGLSPHPAVG